MTIPPPIPAPLTLSPDQLQQLADAQRRWKKIRRAISVATFDAWGTAVFAGLTLLSVFFGWIALPLGAGMAIVAFVEFRGAERLRRLDANAARTLGFNQIFFGGLLFAYAMYMLYTTYHHPSDLSSIIGSDPMVESQYGSMRDLERLINTLLYEALATIAIAVQGGTAIFYFTREKFIRQYVSETPGWIVQMQQHGAGL